MIDEGFFNGKYIEASDTTHADLKHFQVILNKNFKDNQPARFIATVDTHKFKTLDEMRVDQLKLCAIIDQTSTYIYNTLKLIAKYLKPLTKNEFTNSNTVVFPDLIKNSISSNGYENASFDIGSLFICSSAEKTINYIITRITYKKEI